MLFVMTSGDLNIDLTQKKLFTKVVSRSTNYQTPLPFVATMRAFRVLTGAKKVPARFRVFQSPPGILERYMIIHQVLL